MNEIGISKNESEFLVYLRAVSIFIIVFGHVGGFWVFRPYSEFLRVFVPVFFFISGAVSCISYEKSSSLSLYYKKRIVGLLTPFYLVCLLSLVVFIVQNGTIPNLDVQNIIKWIQVRPSNAIMPFPLGQVWFLNTLIIIIIVSPLYFKIKNTNEIVLVFLLFVLIGLSGVQLFFDIDQYFSFLENDFYNPIIHSSFFIFGALYISSCQYRDVKILVLIMVVSLSLSIVLAKFLNLNIDFAFHTCAPDAYYVLGSFSAIALLLLIKNHLIRIVNGIGILKIALEFFYKHTFSIFLLHTFSIYLSEVLFGMVDPQEKTVSYGVIKLVTVLLITSILAKPYSATSSFVISKILKIIVQQNDSRRLAKAHR